MLRDVELFLSVGVCRRGSTVYRFLVIFPPFRRSSSLFQVCWKSPSYTYFGDGQDVVALRQVSHNNDRQSKRANKRNPRVG